MLVDVLSLVLGAGKVSAGVARTYLAPLPKPGSKTRGMCSRVPVSLIATVIKVLGSVMYYRVPPMVAPRQGTRRCAYRRIHGAEIVLAEILDFSIDR